MVGVVAGEQGGVFHEHRHGFQDKRDEELNVNEVPGAAQPPVRQRQTEHVACFPLWLRHKIALWNENAARNAQIKALKRAAREPG